jgi:hypothetical protein
MIMMPTARQTSNMISKAAGPSEEQKRQLGTAEKPVSAIPDSGILAASCTLPDNASHWKNPRRFRIAP